MSDGSAIEWTDATWNPVRGCVEVSPGCDRCYARTFAERWRGVPGHAYEQGFDLRLVPEKLGEPLTWRKPRKVFVNSMSDLFQKGVPNDFVAACFGVMAATPRHTYQLLTKRPGRAAAWFRWLESETSGEFDPPREFLLGTAAANLGVEEVDPGGSHPFPLPNVLIGASVEDRKHGLPRIAGRSNGAVHVADPRLDKPGFDKAYGVLGWSDPAHTVAGTSNVGCGAFSVADPRPGEVDARVMTLDEALTLPIEPESKPKWVPVIIARDGTWHRPLTTLELAALQGIPTTWKGAPLKLAGDAQSRWRERIGNAVPVGTAEAIARQMLLTLGANALGAYSLSSNAVWVEPPFEERALAEPM